MVSGLTRLAIQTFKKKARLERRIEELRLELEAYVTKIPEEDMPYYVDVTDRILEEEGQKLETYVRRKTKRGIPMQEMWRML